MSPAEPSRSPDPTPTGPPEAGEIAVAALRGAIAAMAMSGMRTFTREIGLIGESPPQAIARQRAKALLRHVPRRRRRAVVELAHWTYGAAGGALFGALPASVRRRRRWVGPVYGLAIWGSFEFGIAPLLGLSQARQARVVERLVLAGDHLLYGLVLSEIRARPHS